MLIITCLYDTFVSLYGTHQSAGYAVYFRSDYERRKASVFSNMIPYTGSVFIGLIPTLMIVYGDRSTIILAIFITLLILSIGVILHIPGIRESEDMIALFLKGHETKERESFWKLMRIAFQHKNFVIGTITYTLYITSYTLWLASGIYWVKDVLQLPYRNAVYIQLASLVGFVGFIPFWAWVAKKIGHVRTYTLGCLLVSITLLPTMWITTLWETVLFTFIGGAGFGCFYIMLFPIASDTYDEVTVDIGRHQEAILSGIRRFFFRIALIIQALVITWVHLITNYNPDPNAKQTPMAIWGIRLHMGLIPSLIILVGFFMMLFFYDLKGEKKQAVIERLKELGL
jgi:GPH family glycoside/pentoside/hexuronide:cation symporter